MNKTLTNMNGLCSKCKGKLHLEDDDCNCLDLICKNLKERCIKAEDELTSLKQRIDGITVEDLKELHELIIFIEGKNEMEEGVDNYMDNWVKIIRKCVAIHEKINKNQKR